MISAFYVYILLALSGHHFLLLLCEVYIACSLFFFLTVNAVSQNNTTILLYVKATQSE